jgi:hypothetical protein
MAALETQQSTSWVGEVLADSSGKFVANALRFATEPEAAAYVGELAWRWTAVRDTRVVPSLDPVNYRWDAERNRAVPLAVECTETV